MFFYSKVAAYKIRQVELTQMVIKRTQELEQTNLELLQERVFIEEQKETLKQANESLNDQNTRVEEYAEEVNSQNEELKNINDQLLEQQTQIIEQSEELKVKNEQLLLQQVQIEEKSKELRAHAENLKEVNDLLVDKQRFIQLQSDKLEESNRELLVLNSTKDRFFSIIAHDLRNPFHAVSGFSEILLRDYKKLPPEKVERFLTLINKSSVNGGNLLENLLQWSRAQTGKISFEPIQLHLIGIVNNVVDLLEGEAQRKNIEIVQAIELEMMAFVDENMLKTILRNLISNAIKFTPEKGTITIKALEKFPLIEISIIDTGVGISSQQMQLLFNVETNISTKGTASESGTGLGLILCKEFVEKNGGKIWVESEVGKGSEFKFTLPAMA